ncbi:MAG TPA: helix-turn-helix domain-containing protein [Solirubrobacteraceae bacterium]|nr:helix-turn-helix domain-containing protein [Solirubrobacteraceae bacterium]
MRRATLGACQLLLEDPELAEAIPDAQRTEAIVRCRVPTMRIARGRWTVPGDARLEDGIGLLVLEGLLIRRTGIDGRFGAELLGEGDLLRPWQGEDAEPPLLLTAGWRALTPARVALLDADAAATMAAWPALTGRLVARALERSRNLAVNMAIVQQARVTVRIHMLLWHLADRWGRVRPDGVIVPLALSHTVLAELVAARRPTVTGALAELARAGAVHPLEPGWRLSGEPPGELLVLQAVTPPAG